MELVVLTNECWCHSMLRWKIKWINSRLKPLLLSMVMGELKLFIVGILNSQHYGAVIFFLLKALDMMS